MAFFHDQKGYGFIEPEETDEDIFIHMEYVGGPVLEAVSELGFAVEQADQEPRTTDLPRVQPPCFGSGSEESDVWRDMDR